jgi:hypothetical protein
MTEYQDEYNVTLTEDPKDEFPLIPAGTYNFRVLEIERMRSKNDKPMVKVRLGITILGHDEQSVFDHIVTSGETEWKASSFFIAIAQKKKGVPFTIDWNNVVGRTGVCVISVRKTDQYGDQNDVKSYLDPDSEKYRKFFEQHTSQAAQMNTQAAQVSESWRQGQF